MRITILFLAFFAMDLAAAPVPKTKTIDKLQGTWKNTNSTDSALLEIKDDVVSVAGDACFRMTIDESASPTRFKWLSLRKGSESVCGVLKVDGDTFTYCFKNDRGDGVYPDGLRSDAGPTIVLEKAK